jgi:hypothetical protein
MLLAMLLSLLPTQPAQQGDWVIFDRNVAVGQVPRLLPPPATLPLPIPNAGGVQLPRPLDSYVGAQLTALKLYPDLAQKALDEAVKDHDRACNLVVERLQDEALTRTCPCGDVLLRWLPVAGLAGLIAGVLGMVAVSR